MGRKFLTITQVSKRFGLTRTWMRELDKSGILPKARRDINNSRVYSREDIEAIKAIVFPTQRAS